MISRREFLGYGTASVGAMVLPMSLLSYSCNNRTDLKISLAQWSLHRSLEKGVLSADQFPFVAKRDYDIRAVEYVNGFYADKANNSEYWSGLRSRCENEGIKSLLIMVDNEGQLGDPDSSSRLKAVENHYKWCDAAKTLGCHSIRVNAFGKGDRNTVQAALVDGLGKLSEYSAQQGIHVLIENHGLLSSDASFLVDVIKAVDNPYLGTLPDFGNWCLNKEWGSTMDNACTETYDRYQGVSELLPYAKGLSAKSYAFDASGQETLMDYKRFLQIASDHHYDGYVGIEYEGSLLSEPDGIRATKTLLESSWNSLQDA